MRETWGILLKYVAYSGLIVMTTHSASPTVPSVNSPFSERMAALEAIVQQMESGAMPLEATLAAYAEGMRLLQSCQLELQQAEQTVLILNQQQQLVPFETP